MKYTVTGLMGYAKTRHCMYNRWFCACITNKEVDVFCNKGSNVHQILSNPVWGLYGTSKSQICVLPACGGPASCLCTRQAEIMAWLGKTGVQTTNCYSSCNSPSCLGKQHWGLPEWLFIRGQQKCKTCCGAWYRGCFAWCFHYTV